MDKGGILKKDKKEKKRGNLLLAAILAIALSWLMVSLIAPFAAGALESSWFKNSEEFKKSENSGTSSYIQKALGYY